jgi:hypothetical protein
MFYRKYGVFPDSKVDKSRIAEKQDADTNKLRATVLQK